VSPWKLLERTSAQRSRAIDSIPPKPSAEVECDPPDRTRGPPLPRKSAKSLSGVRLAPKAPPRVRRAARDRGSNGARELAVMIEQAAAPAAPPDAAGKTHPRAHPLTWVPSLYFAMGTPMIAVSAVSAVLYKNLGMSNADIAFHTGAMYLPWTIKPLWAPVVEMFRTKRFFVIAMELTMMVSLGAVALALPLPGAMPLTLALFWVTGFASATQDIAADGVYIASMSRKEQAYYAGVQGICWNIGRVIAAGVLVSFTGMLHDERGFSWPRAWMVVMAILAGIMGLAAAWHTRVLPSGGKAVHAPTSLPEAGREFARAFVSFFEKRGIWAMIAFAYFYRFGEGLIEKIGPLFLLDSRALGGLGLTNTHLGAINGTYGTVGFIGGALLGGFFAARLGLKRALIVLCLALNVPHVTYLYLSQVRPESLTLITVAVTIEKFGYGFGSVGHMLYMMQQMAPGPYKTAHYAFATGIMGLCMMSSGMASGYLQQALGYQAFFVAAICASILPIATTYFAPFHVETEDPAPQES
jgi:PAT family beta-lactamase induction signal transducer AmpG